ncbi:MAG: hypothetical protein UT08_C0009G0014 [Candidatus Woesebacteria bacterium GW2011_GWB1_38_8]|uniref:Terminase small subunit n=1 Tax=Candidatus Woesebacteria bacterium GW2011_GWB1_38_8 TaxID=1618570 RepID=A0A0G0LBF7_9BACT|nr:MAG: hypothetical protein UT08_C0009G0014 [Candidatus Woesebacteria bacterium GW2011_GWB1_38_8]
MLNTLNQRQRIFIYHYFKGLSLTRSAIEAGYTKKPGCAAVQGSRLLKNVKVRNAIEYLNEQSKITPSAIVSKLARVFHDKNTTAGNIIKLSKLFFKIEGLDFNNSDARRPIRNKRRTGVGSISYFPDKFIEVKTVSQVDTYNKEGIIEEPVNKAHRFTEDSSLKIEQAVPKSIPKAVPMQIPKATPKPGEMRNPVAAYSPSNFKEDEVRIAQSGRVFYPA